MGGTAQVIRPDLTRHKLPFTSATVPMSKRFIDTALEFSHGYGSVHAAIVASCLANHKGFEWFVGSYSASIGVKTSYCLQVSHSPIRNAMTNGVYRRCFLQA